MRLAQFIEEYCKDILQSIEDSGDPLAAPEFSYDDWAEDANGNREKILFCQSGDIYIRDIVELSDGDFKRKYPTAEAFALYKRYLESFTILWGEEVINRARLEMEKLKQKLKTSASFNPSDIWGDI